MNRTQDVSTAMQNMAAALVFDTTTIQGACKTSAALSEKLAEVALEAAEKSTEISTQWTRDALGKAGDLVEVTDAPIEYYKALNDFVTAHADLTVRNLTAFAAVAKKAQEDAVDLMLAAAKDLPEDAATEAMATPAQANTPTSPKVVDATTAANAGVTAAAATSEEASAPKKSEASVA